MKLCAAAGGIGKHDLSEDFEHLIAHCMSKPFRARLSLESWKVGRYKKLCNFLFLVWRDGQHVVHAYLL